jgi:hypothetical protein
VSTSIQGAIDTISTEGVAIGQEMADTGLAMFLDPTAPRAAGSTFGQNIVYGMSSAQAAALREGQALGAVFAAAAAGATPDLTSMAAPAAAVTSSGADAKPEKPKDPFKDLKAGLEKSVAQLKSRTRLIAAGVPAALADSIVGAEGFKQITKRLLEGGRKAVGEFVKLWAEGSEGQAAIAAGVDKMVATIQKRIDDAKKLAQDFQKIANGFIRMVLDVRKIGTFQPAAGVPITGEGIVANLQQRLGMVREFNRALTQLAKLGLNKSSRLEILQMGPMDGLAYAQALVAAGKSTISDINTLQGQFVTPANVLGNMGAELQTGTTAAALEAKTNFDIRPGGIVININGEIDGAVRQQITDAVTAAFREVGREQRNRGRTGVR